MVLMLWGISDTHGSTKGKKVNLIITQPINSYYELPYAFEATLLNWL